VSTVPSTQTSTQPSTQSRRRRWLVVVGVVALLVLGGCATAVFVGVQRSAGMSQDDFPGSATNALTLTEGQSFEVDGFSYAAGWAITSGTDGVTAVTGLRLTSHRDELDYLFAVVKLLQGNEIAAQLDCTAPEGHPVEPGETVRVACTSDDPLPATWDRVTIQDRF
jgi:hypothetical protein